MVKWYKDNFEEELKIHFQNDNRLGIISILKKIEFICQRSDLEKLEMIYSNENYEKFIDFSDYIFSLVVDFVKKNGCSLTNKDFFEYTKKIEEYDLKIPKILKNKYFYYKSECILDLEYLKNKGQVSSYSFRTYNLLMSLK